jgi:hypothetical protein
MNRLFFFAASLSLIAACSADDTPPPEVKAADTVAPDDMDAPTVGDVDDVVDDQPDAFLADESEAQRLAMVDDVPDSAIVERCKVDPVTVAPLPEPTEAAYRALEATGDTITIPVHFHVVRKGTAISQGNVPRARLVKQVQVLNDSYSGETNGANTRFRFRLASIERVTSAKWFAASMGSADSRSMRRHLHKGGIGALNVYTKSDPSIIGKATWPWDVADSPNLDGIQIHHATVPGGSFTHYNRGDTAVHEAGHWLGLFHTFDDNQTTCSPDMDWVEDTPAEKKPAYKCNTDRDTCPNDPGHDPVRNFMDYTADGCMFKFTRGQAKRMSANWAYRD